MGAGLDAREVARRISEGVFEHEERIGVLTHATHWTFAGAYRLLDSE